MKATTRRIRNRRNSSFLTHGADDYDHRGLNRARREHGKAIIREWMEQPAIDDEPAPATAGETTFRVVLSTQIYENYGVHACECESEESCTCRDYWKAKGGSEYHRSIGTASDVIALGSTGVQAVVDELIAKHCKRTRGWDEYAIGWSVVPSTEETYDERMYREMYEEGWWPAEHADEIYAGRLASLQG